MKKFNAIFSFEYMGYMKNKVFIGVTASIMVAILVLAFIPNMYAVYKSKGNVAQENKTLEKAAFIGDKEMYTQDILAAYLPQYEWEYSDDVAQAKEKMENEELSIAVETQASSLDAVIYVRSSDLLSKASTINQINEALSNMIVGTTRELLMQDVEPGVMDKVAEITSLKSNIQSVSVGKDSMGAFWFGYVLVIVLYITIVIYGKFILTSVIAEKSSKTMELLITSAKPIELMFGKVLGVGCAALSQLALILITVLVSLKLNQSAWEGFSPFVASMIGSPSLSVSLVANFFIFFILGFFFYSFIYAALASLTSRMEEANSIAAAPILLSIVGFYVAILGVMDINSIWVKVFSFLPFSSPMVMFMRVCIGAVSTVEVIVSIVILAGSVYLIGLVSSRIYRLGVLLYGNRPTLRNIIGMIGKS